MTMDEALAQGLADDLDRHFEALVRGHQDRLFSLALRSLGDASDAEEVTQDAFVRAYRALAGYDAERRRTLALRPWLSTIVLNLCRNRARRPRPHLTPLDALGVREQAAGSDSSGDQLRGESPEASALQHEEAEAWARRVRALPARYRDPILLRYVDDLAYGEMSAALAIPEGTLRAQVHRGLALLRTAVERETEAAPPDRTSLRLQEVIP